MNFTLKSAKNDPVKIYVSDDGFYKIVKRPSSAKYVLLRVDLFHIMGEVIDEFDTLADAMNA